MTTHTNTALEIAPPEVGLAAPMPEGALAVLRDELLALDARSLAPINVDVAAAAVTVLGVAPRIRAHRSALVALVGEEMTACVDRLELLARALLEAQGAHQAVQLGAEIPSLSKELLQIRALLLAEVRLLIARGTVPASAIRALEGVNGYKSQCSDALLLVSILAEAMDEHSVDPAILVRAEVVADALADAVGTRDRPSVSQTADMRQRAFSLLATTYDDARRIIEFLRWKQGDGHRIAPSLYRGHGGHGGRGRRRRVADE